MRLHFLNIAEASLAELGYCLHVAHRLGYISEETLADLDRDLNGVGAPLVGLIRSARLTAVAEPMGLILATALVTYWMR